MARSWVAQRAYNNAWEQAAQKLNEWTIEKTGDIIELLSVLSEAHNAIQGFCHSRRMYPNINYEKHDIFLKAVRDFLGRCRHVYPGVFDRYEPGTVMITHYEIDGKWLRPFWLHGIEACEQRNRRIAEDPDTIFMTMAEFFEHCGHRKDYEKTRKLFRDVIAFGQEFLKKISDGNNVIESLEQLFFENESLLRRASIHYCVEENFFDPIYPLFLNGSNYIKFIGTQPKLAKAHLNLVKNEVKKLKYLLKTQESCEVGQNRLGGRGVGKRKRVQNPDRDEHAVVKQPKIELEDSMDEMDLD
ncbi:hypothetical protein BZA77DRAFT_294701 [Pyronema omphalodes]|nr:hypothetical protein BZA77DRAFT_294701 [Pyronema omphalodes]